MELIHAKILNEKSSFCGLPSKRLNIKKYSVQFKTNVKLCVLNSYRKIMMAFNGVSKFKVNKFVTNDRFLIQEFIQTRIMQLPLNLDGIQANKLVVKLDVHNKLQEPMIVYTNHLFTEYTDDKGVIRRKSIVDQGITDTFNLFKLQENCNIQIELSLIEKVPEKDDKCRGCFISIFEDESKITESDQNTYISERKESIVFITTDGSMGTHKFSSFFSTNKLEQMFKSERLIRVDKDQSTIVFNDIPAFVVDALQCVHKDYFFSKFQSVVPTITDDYQSCIILVPKSYNISKEGVSDIMQVRAQNKQDIELNLDIAINMLISLMRELEQQVKEIFDTHIDLKAK